ncbi:MAG: hypothetical protein AB7U83_21345 [Vicinamibacterales bacterium]
MRWPRRNGLAVMVGVVAVGAWRVGAAVVPGLGGGPVALPAVQTAPAPSPPAQPAPPPRPRCDRPEHRQFDYWVGEWDVRPAGQPESAPTALGNVIRLEDGGCVVTEHWTTPQGSGRSVNIFDRTRNQWHQTWVDSSGGLHQYWGQADAAGNIVFVGETPAAPPANTRQTVRLTFFNLGPDRQRPNRVRQFSEVLGADGRWTTNYDLMYFRRSARP